MTEQESTNVDCIHSAREVITSKDISISPEPARTSLWKTDNPRADRTRDPAIHSLTLNRSATTFLVSRFSEQ